MARTLREVALAGARRRAHIGSRLNSIPVCVLYLDNQSRPPPHRVRAPPAPHPRVGRGDSEEQAGGRPAATAGTYRAGRRGGYFFGVVKASGSSAFSPLSCFWFRPLQTNRWRPLGPCSPSLSRIYSAIPPALAAEATLHPELLKIRLGMCRAGLLQECLFCSPLHSHPSWWPGTPILVVTGLFLRGTKL